MKLRHVVNTKRKFGEAGCYYYAKVTLPNGVMQFVAPGTASARCTIETISEFDSHRFQHALV